MNRTGGRAVAAVGAVLVIVALWLDALSANIAGETTSYWDLDGTFAAFGLGAAILAVLLVAAAYMGWATDGWVAAVGFTLVGYYGWFPAVLAFNDWDQTKVGLWLAFAGAVLISLGAAATLIAAGGPASTPAGTTATALTAALGVALVFPGIFLSAEGDRSYWEGPAGFGHSLGIVMLIVAVLTALAWVASATGAASRGLDATLTLVLLGLVAFEPIGAAFNQFGDLKSGAWLAFAGGILAAGGTWAARGMELPHAAAAPV